MDAAANIFPVKHTGCRRVLLYCLNQITGKIMNTTFERKSKEDGGTNEWLTPPQIIKALGEFDLDPCAPENRPWDTAKKHYTKGENGLLLPWEGRVWCNPSYENETMAWLKRCAKHRNCIALTFARTDFFYMAYAVLLLNKRLKFHQVSGEQGISAGKPSVLLAFDEVNAEALAKSGLAGRLMFP
jgi:hypothetical protein